MSSQIDAVHLPDVQAAGELEQAGNTNRVIRCGFCYDSKFDNLTQLANHMVSSLSDTSLNIDWLTWMLEGLSDQGSCLPRIEQYWTW